MADIREFQAIVAPDVLACPDPIITREIRSALIEFCEKTQLFTKEITVAVDTGSIDDTTQNSLTIDLSAYLSSEARPTRINQIMVDTYSFVPKKRDVSMTHANWEYLKEEGVKYYHIVSNSQIKLADMSTDDGDVFLEIVCKPTRAATGFEDFLLEDWSEAIVSGAKYKLLAMPGKEWSDFSTANYYRAEWRKYLSAAKAIKLENVPGETQQVNAVDYEFGA